jgi:predicted nucleic acid-binding protein
LQAALLEQHRLSTNYHTYDFHGTVRSYTSTGSATEYTVDSRLMQMVRIIQCESAEELQEMRQVLARRKAVVSVSNEMKSYLALRQLLGMRLNAEQAEVRPAACSIYSMHDMLNTCRGKEESWGKCC